ncbi:nitrite reductase small subunit NirD [Thalassomonas sp. M1454]|uniref:nitrite reductase small subunit NirD n=1 Tax=Thalassomonas sp. M1454 TaxID=2594477 RepID=UPI00117D7392|nr:nitrite reductase small subunit NirD [Thalassomonas sp. M1454]TRX53402.1 nitrite reductase small subunit NirD [Thalassomonas sp. M1454]
MEFTNDKQADKNWIKVCSEQDLVKDAGVCALINDQQIAIFHLEKAEQKLFAVGNFDPIGKANVIYRGIVGSINDEPVVASPLYKQHFSLLTGQCLQDEASNVPVYLVRVQSGEVQLFV